jgi:phenylalanine-4-hydroxylase
MTPEGNPSRFGAREDPMARSHGATDHALRGDYSRMRADWTVDQEWSAYPEADHDRWRRLYHRQMELVPGRACAEFERALRQLDYETGIPRFEAVNEKLARATRWRLVAVPGLLPDPVFFDHLANRRFPVTVWLREEHEFSYIVEPDVFHDFFGHVPLLFDPVFADYLQAYGQGGLKADRLGGLKYLARLYWYTVEFGLIRTPGGLRNYGAGILSSPGEIVHALTGEASRRVAFDLRRVMRSLYKIDTYQETYFVIDSFQQLFDETAPDFAPYYEELKRLEDLPANAGQATDTLLPPNPA